jgi:hypothetical protein
MQKAALSCLFYQPRIGATPVRPFASNMAFRRTSKQAIPKVIRSRFLQITINTFLGAGSRSMACMHPNRIRSTICVLEQVIYI